MHDSNFHIDDIKSCSHPANCNVSLYGYLFDTYSLNEKSLQAGESITFCFAEEIRHFSQGEFLMLGGGVILYKGKLLMIVSVIVKWKAMNEKNVKISF